LNAVRDPRYYVSVSIDAPRAYLRRLAAAGAVDVWRVPLGTYANDASLSAAEQMRAERRIGDERRRFVVSHAATRAIVADYLDVPPSELRMEMRYGDKPRLANARLEISLAHSGDLALVALATTPVGVDLERMDDLPDDELDDLAEFSLTRRELDAFAALDPPRRRHAFLRVWTRKEAYLKAIGKGIAERAMAEIDVSAGDAAPRLIAAGDDEINSFALIDLDPAPGFVGAVAVAADDVAVTLHDWDPAPAAASATVGEPDRAVS